MSTAPETWSRLSNANTVAFRKNGVDVASPRQIADGEEASYYFACEANQGGNVVTIVV